MPKTGFRILKIASYGGLAVVAAALLWFIFAPSPLPVETAQAMKGPLQVTVDEDGETRARDRFVVSAPAAGRVLRIELREGDPVAAGQLLAELLPLPLTAREREEQLAAIVAAEASAREAAEQARRIQVELEQAHRDRQRMDKLAAGGFVAHQVAEQARMAEETKTNELEASRFRARSAEADAKAARAALLAMQSAPAGSGRIPVRSPAAGKVLRIPERSERVVSAGTALVTIGDPKRIEVVVDLLSTDAVKVMAGMPVLIEGWGGAKPLRARVRLIEPYGFTKVSALGVEEQRVNVIIDFVDPPDALGDAYRIEAKIVVWSGENVLKIPVSALFRRGGVWSVFVVESGRARVRDVEIGQRSAFEAEIVKGLQPGEIVVRHPSNDVAAGTRVRFKSAE